MSLTRDYWLRRDAKDWAAYQAQLDPSIREKRHYEAIADQAWERQQEKEAREP